MNDACEGDVRGWTILSDDETGARETIKRGTTEYGINQIQLSHQIIMDLKEIRDDETRTQVADLTTFARDHGIDEVAVWDHSLYDLGYYPDEYKTADGCLDLDDPAFWDWFRDDYREMLDRTPDVDALVLTFIETGAKIRDQHSTERTESELVATVVNVIAEILSEYEMVLYARTFAYTEEEYELLTAAVEAFEHDRIKLMMKEVPHDFFLTHPQNPNPSQFDRETLVEFDAAGEYHGQGVVLNSFPEQFLDRARSPSLEGYPGLLDRENVVGYSARMDRFGDTHIVDTPAEMNAAALEAYVEEPEPTAEAVYDTFVAGRYGDAAVEPLGAAFRNGLHVTLATFYTLNTNTADHSRLNYDPTPSSYARHVSGRWLEPPRTYVPRGVDEEFHYWRDVVYHLAPNWAKQGGTQLEELTEQQIEWIGTDERMNETYLDYVLTEKDYGVELAEENLEHLADAKGHLTEDEHERLETHFRNTRLCAKLRRETAAAYWGFRVWSRGGAYRSEDVEETVSQALDAIPTLCTELESISPEPRAGEWSLTRDDPERARQYHRWITSEGWPEAVQGIPVSFGGLTFGTTDR